MILEQLWSGISRTKIFEVYEPKILSFLRIVGAEMQNIVYGQFLPQILGPQTMNTFNLGIDGPSTYNSHTDPSIINAFATAAFRFGHSAIRNMVKIKNIITSIETSYRYLTVTNNKVCASMISS